MVKIPLERKNNMGWLIAKYPNLSDDMLLEGGCYLLKMKNGSIIIYDCRRFPYKSIKLRGFGYEFNINKTDQKTIATRHIEYGPSGICYGDVDILFLLIDVEFESFISNLKSAQEHFQKILSLFHEVKTNNNDIHRFFCSTSLNVIVNVKPNSYILNPVWCKASAVYDAEEELSLISPYSTGFTWSYYPGRMYFRKEKWFEITEHDYNKAKNFILLKENEIFTQLANMMNN